MNLYLQPWRKYADFDGRAGLGEFWVFTLVNAAIVFVVAVCAGVATGGAAADGEAGTSTLAINALVTLFGLAALLPSIAVGVRRLHDSGKTGWLLLLFLVPLLGGLILLVLYILPPTPGENRYGAPSAP